MSKLHDELTRTAEVVEQGIAEGLHLGAQVYVSLRGETVADLAFGEARPGEPMTIDHLLRWMSAVKPVMAVSIAQLWEADKLRLDDPVALHIAEFAANGKERVTLRHLLTHTAGLPHLDLDWTSVTHDEVLGKLYEAVMPADWAPGEKAGYQPMSSWFILGEVVRRLSGQSYPDYAREHVLLPAGMQDSWVGMPEETYQAYGDRIATTYNSIGGKPELFGLDFVDRRVPWPGGSGRGPLRELGRFYEMLLAGGTIDGRRIVSSQSVEALTARHRVRMLDQTFGQIYDWGLGFMLDSQGAQNVKQLAYDFGAHGSRRTFGHGGSQCATGFCDPEYGLVVAWAFNTMAGEPRHRRRNHAMNTAIYEDLGLG